MNSRNTMVSGHPALTPMIDLVTTGAGGGSVAYVGEAGGVHVGPRSAGSEPSPACYGHGGEEPTVTDAQVVLGRLDLDLVLGGDLRLDPDLQLSRRPRRADHAADDRPGGRGAAVVYVEPRLASAS